MTDLQRIIGELEQQRNAIDRAIAALREITPSVPAVAKRSQEVSAEGKRRMSPEGRQRIVDALKRRWAAKRAAETSAPKKKTASKGRNTKKTSPGKNAAGRKPTSKAASNKGTATKSAGSTGATQAD